MKALVYKNGGREYASVKDVPVPIIAENQVLVKVMACGICKPAESRHDNGTSMMGEYPVIPGHEFSGIVEKVGSRVSHVKPGDRVAVDNGAPCWSCYHCQRGEFALCDEYKAMGQNIDGGFAEFAAAPESHVYKIPDGVSMRAAALSELTGCCFHSIERCQIPYSADVLVLGCGASGMLMAMLAKGSGAATVVSADCIPEKLEHIAKKNIETVLVDRADYGKHEEELKRRFPHGFDVIIDASGDAALAESSLKLLKKGGTFAAYSFSNTEKKDILINIAQFASQDLTFIGTTFQHHRFQQVLHAMETGKVDPESIVTDIYPLDQFFEALDKNLTDPYTVKILVEPNGSSEGL